MTNRTAANRYARALLDVGVREHADLDRIDRELSSFADLLTQYRELGTVLLNPAVPVPRKRGAVVELTSRANLSPIVSKLLVLLAERDRLVLLGDVVASYHDRLLDHQKIVRAEVTTATGLDSDRAREVERSLANLTGRSVMLAWKIDPSIIGGLVARIGSTVYDGSVAGQLERMRERLAGE